MADSAEAGIAACCGLCAFSALQSWCNIHAFGADCCGGPQGCCGSCFDSSFNDDDFDERAKNAQANNGADAEPVDSQPAPSQDMSTTITGDQKPTNVSED